MYSVGITYLLISMVLSFFSALSIRFLPLGLLLEIVAKIILGRLSEVFGEPSGGASATTGGQAG